MDNKKQIVSDINKCVPIIVESTAYEGVKKIASKAAGDMELVIGRKPCITDCCPEGVKEVVLFATAGRSSILDKMEQDGKIDLSRIKNLREVYGIFFIENPYGDIRKMLVVAGSDKRGTIYGIFRLSEKFGVSPLVYWGDVYVECTGSIVFNKDMEEISKEPSVKYRGFFINDEWPCFGNWAMEHFGGFCAEMYDKVFELLLRLKGNYLWPAMWSSSFALDGPGSRNEELADEYGVIIGNSHHEPCLRAGEEWDIYKGINQEYGTEWNYATNKDGLLKFWRDGLIRSGKYENIITVGMRGERDSIMQGSSSLEESINLWKDIITMQDSLISRYADTKDYTHPRLVAIYKEVEEYFYGTDKVKGLKDWDGLDSAILMFCEDNYGYMRKLPDQSIRKHTGGFGMYYHLDYHGSPVSYEWINTTQLSKIWEQMTQAYEYGIRDIWIVNAGDIKGNEFPLSYFMDMAYDFDKWGTKNLDSYNIYTMEWVKTQFNKEECRDIIKPVSDILNECINLASMRKPESLDGSVFHAYNYDEADRMVNRVIKLKKKSDNIKRKMPAEYLDTYYSIIEYQVLMCTNTLLMNLYAGKNRHYAEQGKIIANKYRDKVKCAIYKNKKYKEEFASFKNGKWKGMEMGHHTGFVKWNEDGCRWPVRYTVEPLDKPQMIVSLANKKDIAVKNYGEPEIIEIRDFLYPGTSIARIEIDNGGKEGFECTIDSPACAWLKLEQPKNYISSHGILYISCIESQLPDIPKEHIIYIEGAGARIAASIWGCRLNTQGFPAGTYFEKDGVVSIHAGHCSYKRDGSIRKWEVLSNYGKLGCAYKALPARNYSEGEVLPVLGYNIVVREEGPYYLEIWQAPSNPLKEGGRIYFGLCVNNKDLGKIPSVSKDYKAGEDCNAEWSQGVMEQVHRTRLHINLNQGLNKIEIYAIDPEFVLEGIFISKDILKKSYLGPSVSYHGGWDEKYLT
ncbi:MAG: glycosyl hydrolase 115 family protein [Lachnospiraceae bacterium]|nr:glycosyl hydrolase 115 family protein [Lachnospiraceae bacterium]